MESFTTPVATTRAETGLSGDSSLAIVSERTTAVTFWREVFLICWLVFFFERGRKGSFFFS